MVELCLVVELAWGESVTNGASLSSSLNKFHLKAHVLECLLHKESRPSPFLLPDGEEAHYQQIVVFSDDIIMMFNTLII